MPHHRTAVTCLAVVATALVVAVSGCGSSGSPDRAADTTSQVAPDSRTVTVNHMAFLPASLTVRAGDTVTWRFQDRYTHSVHGLGGNGPELDSPLFDKGGVWQHRFTTAGTYRYTCPLHSDMNGTVVVLP
jgi:plastocyanin